MSADRANRSALEKPERFTAQILSVRLLFVRNAELVTAFGSPAFQNEATATGCHAGAETEFAIAFYFAGLICPFHGTLDSFICKNPELAFARPVQMFMVFLIQQATQYTFISLRGQE